MTIRDLLAELEAVPDALPDLGGEPDPGGEPTEPAASEAAPAGPQFDFNDPALQELIDQRAADLVDARLAAQQQEGQPPQSPGEPVDWNELLDPMGDRFGESLVGLLQQRDQWLLEQWQQQMEPLRAREEQAQAEQGAKVIDGILDDAGAFSPDPNVNAKGREHAKNLALSYLPEMEQRYGQGNPRAAEQALQRGIQAVRELTGAAAQTGGQAEIDRLAAVAGAGTAPQSSAAGGVVQPGQAKTPRELFNRTFGLVEGGRS